jgi:pimeloyl-ACP methyl ester carboxylesterase
MPQTFWPDFRTQAVETEGATIHVRIGGQGPAIVMLHGFSDRETMADDIRFVATDVTGTVIPNSGHWLMKEQPAATVAVVRAFLDE